MADKDIFRPPQATAAELAAASGIVGEIVYNSTTGRHQQWDGAAWVDIGGSGGSGGHVIRANGTSRPARAGLNFSAGFSVTDDNGNDETDVELARAVNTQHSLTGGGTLSQDRTLSLVGDTASPGASKVYGTDASGVRGWQNAGSAAATWYEPTLFTYSGSTMALDFQSLPVKRLQLTADYGGQFPLPTGMPSSAPIGAVMDLTLLIEQDGTGRSVTHSQPWGLYSAGEWPAAHEIDGAPPYVDRTANATTVVNIRGQKDAGGIWRFLLSGMIQSSEVALKQRVIASGSANYTFASGDNGVRLIVTPTQALTYTVPSNMPPDWHCDVVQRGTGGSVSVAVGGSGELKSWKNAAKLDGENAIAHIWVESNPAGNNPRVGLAGNLTT